MSTEIIRNYDSTFTVILNNKDRIRTTVTSSASAVSSWISSTLSFHRSRLHRLIVGLDAEWRPNFTRNSPPNPIAILQLCVGRSCLIFQLIHSDFIPQSLADFLSDGRFTFVGVGIGGDAQRLEDEYGLRVAKVRDLRHQAAAVTGREEMRGFGLQRLVNQFMRIDLDKKKRVTMSRWDDTTLSEEQLAYAAVDAFTSFEIGMALRALEVFGSMSSDSQRRLLSMDHAGRSR